MLKPLDLCKEEDRGGRPTYVIDPAKMYPAVIARLKEIKENDEQPSEVVNPAHPNALPNWRRRIRRISPEALNWALVPKDDVAEENLAARAEALSLAWAFYKVALRAAGAKTNGANQVMSVHLLNENAGKVDDETGELVRSAWRQ